MTPEQQKTVEELFSRYSRGVGSFLLARVGDAELAEELTARVFAAVVGAIGQCSGPPAGWLWTIVRNELAMHFRSKRSTRRLDELELHDPRELPDRAEQSEAGDQMTRALRQLPEEWQKIVWMKFFQDMSNTAIAEALSLTPGHVGVLVHRALKQLRLLMTEMPHLEAAPMRVLAPETGVRVEVRFLEDRA